MAKWTNLKLFHGDFMDILNKIYVYLQVLRARGGQNINVAGGSREKVFCGSVTEKSIPCRSLLVSRF